VQWSTREQAVIARRTVELDALVLEEQPLAEVPADAARGAMLTGVRELGIAALPWNREARDLQARIEFVAATHAGWPACRMPPWAQRRKPGSLLARRRDAPRAPGESAAHRCPACPAHLGATARARGVGACEPYDASGSRIRVDYLDDSAPAVSVRLQEVFGLADTPRLGAAACRHVQAAVTGAAPGAVTRDLASFWRGAYAEVRKDLRGRYPKHYWPRIRSRQSHTRRAPRR